MARRFLRITGWIVGSVLGLIVTAYLVVVAINWRDRAPSEEATRLTNAYRDRPPLADSDNAYVYVMGFKDRAADRQARPESIKTFIEACRPGGPGCADAFSSGSEVFERWMASEGSLLERYRTFIAHAGWQETVPFDVSEPLPGYGLVMDGQRHSANERGTLPFSHFLHTTSSDAASSGPFHLMSVATPVESTISRAFGGRRW